MLSEQVIAYCERMDVTYWSEPVNAVTNASFLIAAALVWRQAADLPLARALVVVLGLIGAGSFLWHTHATRWAGLADVLPILVFILLYLFCRDTRFPRHACDLGLWRSAGVCAICNGVFLGRVAGHAGP